MDITSYLLGKQAGGGGGSATLQTNKAVTITTNGETEVNPDEGYDGLKKATVTTNVQPNLESKQITISSNTTTTISPTQGKDGLSSVEVITQVPGIVPSGTLNITSNNTYDVTNYASAEVNVPTGEIPTKGVVFSEWDNNGFPTKASVVGMANIPQYYFYTYATTVNNGLSICAKLKNVILPEGLTAINNSAFSACYEEF